MTFTNVGELIQNTYDDFISFENTGKIDLKIVNTLDEIKEQLEENEKYWIDNNNISLDESFSFYLATRNSRLLIQKITKRVSESQKSNDNPQIALDSINILPLVQEISSILYKAYKKQNNLDSVTKAKLVDYIFSLRAKAHNLNLSPEENDELERIDMQDFKENISKFCSNVFRE